MSDLVNNRLKPSIGCLDLTGHVGELETNDGVLNEFLAKRATLVSVLDGFFVANTGEAEALNDDAYALVVEVGHDD
jgi:hypothetical protein